MDERKHRERHAAHHHEHQRDHAAEHPHAQTAREAREAALEQMRAHVDEQHPHIKRARDARLEHMRAHLQGRNTPRQEEIVTAALALLDAGGLGNLSLREIAKRLNIRAPALYWYFKSKDELVDYMAEAILHSEFADLGPRQADETWQDWLGTQMVRLRRAMLAHADGGRVVAGAHMYPATTLSELFEQILISLESAGLDLQTAYHIAMTTTRYTFGYVIEEQASPTPGEITGIDLAAHMAPFPHMARAMSELERRGPDPDGDFEVGLRYILKGSSPE